MNLFIERILSYFPRKLPIGITEFEVWAARIIRLAGKFADEDSMKFALASNVIHLDHQRAFVPDHYFVRSLTKAAANQVASQVFSDIKQKQLEAAQKAAAEATAKESAVVLDEKVN